MPILLIFSLLLSRGPLLFAEAQRSTYRGDCATALEFARDAKGGRRVLPTIKWEEILSLLSATQIDRDWATEFVEYYAASFAQVAAGKSVGDLRAHYLALQAGSLLRLYDELISERDELVSSQELTWAAELRYLREVFAKAKGRYIREEPWSVWQARQKLVEKERQVTEDAQLLKTRVEEDWATLKELRRALKQQTDRDLGPNLATLLQFQIFGYAIIQDLESTFGLGQSAGHALRDHFDLDLRFDQEEIRAWARNMVRDPLNTHLCGTTGKEVVQHLQSASEEFITVTPVIGDVSETVRLAVGFLPLEFLTLSFPEKPAVSLVDQWGHPRTRDLPPEVFRIWSHPETGRPALAKHPVSWITALNQSWNNWFLLLGGQLRGTMAIHQPTFARAANEEVLRALLHVIRYTTVVGEGHDWGNPARLLELLFDDTIDAKTRRELDRDLVREVRKTVRAFGREREVEARDVASAIDLMIARLSAHPNLRALPGGLQDALHRAPLSALTRRLTQKGFGFQRQIEDQRGRTGND